MLFFSSGGKVYKLKVWRLPMGAPTSRGKAFINLFPIEPGETMTSILPLPEEEARWEGMDLMFATRSGTVRRNRLSDFTQVNKAGKIAMKLAPGETPQMKLVRFRTLGCYPLTGAIESSADTIEAIVTEMLTARTSERQGRVIDHDENASMEKKKREGYF